MADFNPDKLHVVFNDSLEKNKLELPRKYTLTHSDSTGDLFLTIGSEYDFEQISSLYTRFMRDEVLAEWQKNNDHYELHIYMQISGFYTRLMRDEVLAEWQKNDRYYTLHLYLHVSGGLLFGWASMRDKIFRHHLPLVFQALKYGDKELFEELPFLNESPIKSGACHNMLRVPTANPDVATFLIEVIRSTRP